MKDNHQTLASHQTAVNFYILADSDLRKRLLFACRLVEKAFDKNKDTLVITRDSEQLRLLNNQIWSFSASRFIPHEMITSKLKEPIPPVLLTDKLSNLDGISFKPQVVIDLTDDAIVLPFPKVMLVANQYQEILSNARMKYQSYVNHGVKPVVHKISFN